MKQLMFNLNAEGKYSKLKTFRLEVNNVLPMYNTPLTDTLVVVRNWFRRKGLQYLETLMTREKDTCNTIECLFETLSNKFKLQYKETIK